MGTIGDTVVALPALRAAQRRFPGITWDVICDEGSAKSEIGVAELLRTWGFIEDVVVIPRSLRAAWAVLARLRTTGYSVCVYLPPRERPTARIWQDRLFLLLGGVKRIVGPITRDIDLGKLPRPVPLVKHETLALLSIVQGRAVTDWSEVQVTRPVTDGSEITYVANLLETLQLERATMLVLGVGSKAPAKLWPVERFIQVARVLYANEGLVPVVVGGKEDLASADELVRAIPVAVNLCGKLSINQTIELMGRAALVISNDSGPLHLAYTSRTPVVGIFAAQDVPGRWSPPENFGVALRSTVSCEGCRLTVCPVGNLCLLQISVADVLSAARELLSSRGRQN